MKHQYFGDKKDYFKYSLVLHLLQTCPGLDTFTFLVMLTPPDDSNDGQHTNYSLNPHWRELYGFLRQCLRDGRRDVGELASFMESARVAYRPYLEPLSHLARRSYFARVNDQDLRRAVVLLDPDTGFEVPSMGANRADRYVLFPEVKALYDRMDDDAVMLVFQYLPRQPRHLCFRTLAARLARHGIGPSNCTVVTDNVIAFIAIARTPERAAQVASALQQYAALRADGICQQCLLVPDPSGGTGAP
jgi:hypothetical protein